MVDGTSIVDSLRNLPDASAVALKLGEQNYADNYINVLQSVLGSFLKEKDVDCIYVTTTTPSHIILNALTLLEISEKRIYFVDTISHIMMSTESKLDKVLYVESPTMLENIMLKIEYLMRKLGSGPKMVFIDSLNSMAIHNDTRILAEFLHILVNNLRTKHTYTLILVIEEQGTEELTNILNLVCDVSIPVRGDRSLTDGGDEK